MILQLNSCQLVVIVVYRLKFHPLSKYPGPLIGRVTDWYSVYHAFKGDRHLDFFDLHKRYGMTSLSHMECRLIHRRQNPTVRAKPSFSM